MDRTGFADPHAAAPLPAPDRTGFADPHAAAPLPAPDRTGFADPHATAPLPAPDRTGFADPHATAPLPAPGVDGSAHLRQAEAPPAHATVCDAARAADCNTARAAPQPAARPVLACVDIPDLALQVVLRRRPAWVGRPVAVAAADGPQAPIVSADGRARCAGVRPGQRVAQAVSLCADLRVAPVPEAEVAAAVEEACAILGRHAPRVEPCEGAPGLFWIDASGLARLHPDVAAWARGLWAELGAAGLAAAVVAGFDRFATFALARAAARPGVRVLASPQEERDRAARVPLSRLALAPALRDALARLGVHDVAGFVRLPADGLLARFGPEAHRLHRLASGRLWDPLRARPERAPARERLDLDDPEPDVERLLFPIKRLVDRIAAALAARGRAVAALDLRLHLEGAAPIEARVRPAAPTLDVAHLCDLVRLRLEAIAPRAPIAAVEVAAADAPAVREQLHLFQHAPRAGEYGAGGTRRRDPRAAARALARVRADLGEDAVVRAAPREGHLPEAQCAWEPIDALPAPRPAASDGPRPLVRRLLFRPVPLSGQRAGPDGWQAVGPRRGEVSELCGPFVLSGGWWRCEVARDYHYAVTRRGDALWIYFDRARGRWFLHGTVE